MELYSGHTKKVTPDNIYKLDDSHIHRATMLCAEEIGGEGLVKQIEAYEHGGLELPDPVFLQFLEERLPGSIEAMLARADIHQTESRLKAFGEDQSIVKDDTRETINIVLPMHLTEL